MAVAREPPSSSTDLLIILLPLLIILSTLLFLLLLFVISILFLRRRRSIMLRDSDGPLDLSRDESFEADGAFEVHEANWMDATSDEERREYRRAKEWQAHYPPNSQPTDITLSQFLSIQEKGVSAWSFEPDYESLTALIVHSRTEITFLPDPPFATSCVQSNLPLPKLNEVYYWEVKMFDLPETTNVAVGLATKPYPHFRLPGWGKFSVAWHSNGEKCHNFPFNATPYTGQFKQGDVIGIGFRPRHGTVFFTRNGRKSDDAYTGLSRWNLFPTVGADGPCSLHVNFGQAGFVYIEANVKKWGLAPMVGTLAPPPAYGSERGSILLAAGGDTPTPSGRSFSQEIGVSPGRRPSSRRNRRSTPNSAISQSAPSRPSPLSGLGTPSAYQDAINSQDRSDQYVSPSDAPSFRPNLPSLPSSPSSSSSSRTTTPRPHDLRLVEPLLSPDSPSSSQLNPPTPHHSDIRLEALGPSQRADSMADELHITSPGGTVRHPPEYAPLDPFRFADGVHLDLPAHLIQAALDGAVDSGVSGTRGRRGNR